MISTFATGRGIHSNKARMNVGTGLPGIGSAEEGSKSAASERPRDGSRETP